MPEFVRVRLADVGEWSQSIGHPVPDGAEILDEPAVDGAGRVIPDRPFPAEADPIERKPFYTADLAGGPDVADGAPLATAPDSGAPAPAGQRPAPDQPAGTGEPSTDTPDPSADPAAKSKIKES